MARNRLTLLVVGALIVSVCAISSAGVPHMINYQGKLTTADGGCLNDTVEITFTIYDDSLGVTPEWTETQTEVVVKEGIFSVLLGAVDSIPASVFDGSTKYLGVQVESDPEMRPLKPMVSVAYAYQSLRADTASLAVSTSGGFFPAPAWNSGWFYLSRDSETSVNHNLGRNPDDYFVDLQFKDDLDPEPGRGINVMHYGRAFFADERRGAYYGNLDSNSITVYRSRDDDFADSLRVRIWIVASE